MTHLRITWLSAIAIAILFVLPIFVVGCGNDDDDGDIVAPGGTNPPPSNQRPDNTNPPDVVDLPDDPQPPEPEPGVSFAQDIEPILDATCAVPGCHQGNAPTGGLNLETYAGFERGGNSGPAFVEGKSKNSTVIKRIDGGGMPRNRPPLDKDQIQLFMDWIDEGAEDN